MGAVGLGDELSGEDHCAHGLVTDDVPVTRVDGAELEGVVAHLVQHAAFVAGEDGAVVVVGELSDARARGLADVEEVGIGALQDFGQEDGGVALEDLHALLVELDHVVDRVAVVVEVGLARILDATGGLGGEAEGIERAQEERAAAEVHVAVHQLLGALEDVTGRRDQGLHVIERLVEAHLAVALVDALDPARRQRVPALAVHPRELALLVVDLGRPVDAGADLHLVREQPVEFLLVHQGEIRDHRELDLLPDVAVLRQSARREMLDRVEGDQRLASLELDGHVGVRRLQDHVDGLVGDLRGHVGVRRVHVGA